MLGKAGECGCEFVSGCFGVAIVWRRSFSASGRLCKDGSVSLISDLVA